MLGPDDILRLTLLAEAKAQHCLDKAEDIVRVCKDNLERLSEIRASMVEMVYARRKGSTIPLDK